MKEKFLLGIDAGTSVVKTVIFNLQGKEIALSRKEVTIRTPKPGWAEQDMEEVWKMVRETIVEAIAKAKIHPSSIAAIGVTGQGDGCRLLDRNKKPVRPSILWIDGRAGDIVTEWERKGLDGKSFEISGHTIFSGSPAAILRWLMLNEPVSLKKAEYFLFAKDWIKFKLTGKICTDPSDASEAPISLKNISYSEELFELFDISSTLYFFPEITHSSEVIGEVTHQAAEECNLRKGIPVISGMIDVVAASIGLGVFKEKEAYTIIGTTSFNGVLSCEPIFSPTKAGMNFVYAFPGKFIRAMAAMAGTLNLDWFIRNFLKNEKERMKENEFYTFLEEKLTSIPPGSEGLIYHPYISPGGERAPFVKPSAKAQFFGIGLRHTCWHLLRAVYEGVALSILDCFSHIPVEISEVRLSGGGAQSLVWSQILCDTLGVPLKISSAVELGALGAAITAGIGVRIYPGIQQAAEETVRFSRIYYPQEKIHYVYKELYKLYKSIYRHLWEDWDARDKLMKGEKISKKL